MDYYRIRKTWNDGKWDKTQKGAYTTLESAIENYKDEYKEQGYFIFSPTGDILYPHHDITQMILDDGVSIDSDYWDNVFKNNLDVKTEYCIEIFKRYSKLIQSLKSNKNIETISYKDMEIFKIPASLVKVRIVDKNKNKVNYSSYTNAGYFAVYKESYNNKTITFTLPVANLVADYSYDELATVSHKYWNERKHTDSKMYFGANENGPQFYNKQVSTLIIKEDDTLDIIRINDIKTLSNIKYAISGYPILLNNKVISYSEALAEGWQSGVTRATSHTFIGITNNNYLYVFGLNTTVSGKGMTTEVINKMKDFGFKSIIKLDGGGSTIIKIDNKDKLVESGNRQINNVLIFG